jgi:hypothetical protein
LFTNIEEALKVAVEGWETEAETSRKSIILLTDGVVDVSKDPKASVTSRKAILEQLAPELQRQSVQVHTVALSENADQELLKALSIETGGWNESVQSAEQLERAFLAMFKKAVPRDGVPLTDNRFTIDAGVNEFSVLVFRAPGAQPTGLLSPGQTRISQDDPGENVRWHHEASYDLITIQKPKAGEWRLLASLDPDNQVLVVTDLKLRLNELPNYVSANQAVEFSVRFTDKGQAVTNPDFLSLIQLRLQQSHDQGRVHDWDLKIDPVNIGAFTQTLGETLRPGKHTFKVIAKSRTFQREAEHRIEVVEKSIHQEKQEPGKAERNPDSLAKPAAHPAAREPDWMMTGVVAGVVNMGFLLGGFFLFRLMKKRLAKQQLELIDRLAA